MHLNSLIHSTRAITLRRHSKEFYCHSNASFIQSSVALHVKPDERHMLNRSLFAPDGPKRLLFCIRSSLADICHLLLCRSRGLLEGGGSPHCHRPTKCGTVGTLQDTTEAPVPHVVVYTSHTHRQTQTEGGGGGGGGGGWFSMCVYAET